MEQGKQFTIGHYSCEGRSALIGKGSFADVYKAENTLTGEIVAIKVIDVARLTRGSEKLKKHLSSEIAIMKKLDHENIVKMHDLYTISESHIYMVFEYCAGGDLAKYLAHKPLPESKSRYFMKQLANGLKFLRSKNIIHRDLKPQNLLLTSASDDAILKIADFGFARFIEPQSVADTLCGSPLYMAPEILKLQKYTIKTDLWSVGAILFEMLTGLPPFPAKSQIELVRLVDQKKRIEFPSNIVISEECASLVRALLQQDPMKRISWEEFFLHPWLGLHETLSSLQSSLPTSMSSSQFMSLPVPISSSKFANDDDVIEATPPNLDLPFASLRRNTSPPAPHYRRPSISTTPPDNFLIGSPPVVGSPPTYPQQRSRTGSELNISTSGIPIPKTRPFKETIPQYSNSLPINFHPNSNSVGGLKAESFPPTGNTASLTNSFGHDSFEIVSTENSLPDFSDEGVYINDLKYKTKRIKAIVSLAELHQEMGKYENAVSLYIKCCGLLQSLVLAAKASAFIKTSAELPHVVQTLKDLFEELVKRCEVINVKEAFVPDRLIYEAALRNGKEGGVYESLKNFEKSEQYYTNGLLMLELLRSDATDESDKETLKNYINNFSKRLAEVKLNRSKQ